MRYEVIERYDHKKGFSPSPSMGHNPFRLSQGDPLRVRIDPEDTPGRIILTSMVMAAYAITAQNSNRKTAKLKLEDAITRLYYERKDLKTLWEKLSGVPNDGMPLGIKAGRIQGIETLLNVESSKDSNGTYEMNTFQYPNPNQYLGLNPK